MSYTIITIGDHIRSDYTVRAYCTRFWPDKCEKVYGGIVLDLEALAIKHGRDADLSHIISRLRCSLCGAPASVSMSHHGRPKA